MFCLQSNAELFVCGKISTSLWYRCTSQLLIYFAIPLKTFFLSTNAGSFVWQYSISYRPQEATWYDAWFCENICHCFIHCKHNNCSFLCTLCKWNDNPNSSNRHILLWCELYNQVITPFSAQNRFTASCWLYWPSFWNLGLLYGKLSS
jgi:hypothetical protein